MDSSWNRKRRTKTYFQLRIPVHIFRIIIGYDNTLTILTSSNDTTKRTCNISFIGFEVLVTRCSNKLT